MLAPIAPLEEEQVARITAYLFNYQLNLMNEATIWSRAIYPLLMAAETGRVQKKNKTSGFMHRTASNSAL
jgi:hypothetical protein